MIFTPYARHVFNTVKTLSPMECATVLIFSNGIMKFMAGKQHKDIIRDPKVIASETIFWIETLDRINKGPRVQYRDCMKSDNGELSRYSRLLLVALDLCFVVTGIGLGAKELGRFPIRGIYGTLKGGGAGAVHDAIRKIRRFETTYSRNLFPVSRNTFLTEPELLRLFFVPVSFQR